MAGHKRKIPAPVEGIRTCSNTAKKHHTDLRKTQLDVPRPPPAEVLTMEEVKESCVALQKKLKRDRQGRRQNGRRRKSEPFHLADNQKVIFAKTYLAARKDERPVDYVRLSNSCHFPTFAGNPDVLTGMEPAIVAEMKEALIEQRAIEAKNRPSSNPDLPGKLAKLQVLYRREIAKMDQRMEMVLARLSKSERLVTKLRKDMTVPKEQHRRLAQMDSEFVMLPDSQYNDENPQKIGHHTQDFVALEKQLLSQDEKHKTKTYEPATLMKTLNNKNVTINGKDRVQDEECRRLGRTALTERMEQRHRGGLAIDHKERKERKREHAPNQAGTTRVVAILDEKNTRDDYELAVAEWKKRCEVEKEMTRVSQAALENSLRDTAELRIIITELKMQLSSHASASEAD